MFTRNIYISSKIFICFFITIMQLGVAQEEKFSHFQIHSHNDYDQNVPFWNAYSNGLNSIEVDIFLKNDTLYAIHSDMENIKYRTIENLYLQPIQKTMFLQLNNQRKLQLLVDIKSEAVTTLKKLVALLKKYPEIITNKNISIVITGKTPNLNDYG